MARFWKDELNDLKDRKWSMHVSVHNRKKKLWPSVSFVNCNAYVIQGYKLLCILFQCHVKHTFLANCLNKRWLGIGYWQSLAHSASNILISMQFRVSFSIDLYGDSTMRFNSAINMDTLYNQYQYTWSKIRIRYIYLEGGSCISCKAANVRAWSSRKVIGLGDKRHMPSKSTAYWMTFSSPDLRMALASWMSYSSSGIISCLIIMAITGALNLRYDTWQWINPSHGIHLILFAYLVIGINDPWQRLFLHFTR